MTGTAAARRDRSPGPLHGQLVPLISRAVPGAAATAARRCAGFDRNAPSPPPSAGGAAGINYGFINWSRLHVYNAAAAAIGHLSWLMGTPVTAAARGNDRPRRPAPTRAVTRRAAPFTPQRVARHFIASRRVTCAASVAAQPWRRGGVALPVTPCRRAAVRVTRARSILTNVGGVSRPGQPARGTAERRRKRSRRCG